MKRFTGSFSLIILILVFLSSCENRSKQQLCGDPGPVIVGIWLVDKNDSSLVGKKYDPDSIRLSVENMSIDLQFDHGEIIFNYSSLEPFNKSTYYLILSKTETDTIKLVVNQQNDGDCGPYYSIDKFSYNSSTISKMTAWTYKIIK
jgi:hypothetical protein